MICNDTQHDKLTILGWMNELMNECHEMEWNCALCNGMSWYVWVNEHMNKCVYCIMHVCMNAYMHVWFNTYMHVWMHACTHTWVALKTFNTTKHKCNSWYAWAIEHSHLVIEVNWLCEWMYEWLTLKITWITYGTNNFWIYQWIARIWIRCNSYIEKVKQVIHYLIM